MTVLAATILAAAVVAAAWILLRSGRDRLLRERLCDRVVVTLKSGSAFSGILFKVDDRMVILRDSHALQAAPDGGNVVVDGEVLLSRADFEFMQRP